MKDRENDFSVFVINQVSHGDGLIVAEVDINKDAVIFQGHFPGQPVVPGACTLQLVKDVLEQALNASVILKKADHLKFISMIDPTNTQAVKLEISYKFVEEKLLSVKAQLFAEEVICFKLQGSFVTG